MDSRSGVVSPYVLCLNPTPILCCRSGGVQNEDLWVLGSFPFTRQRWGESNMSGVVEGFHGSPTRILSMVNFSTYMSGSQRSGLLLLLIPLPHQTKRRSRWSDPKIVSLLRQKVIQ